MLPVKSTNTNGPIHGINNKISCYRRIQLLFCTKDLWCYYVGFWLILAVSLLAWTRTNLIVMDGTPTSTTTNTNTISTKQQASKLYQGRTSTGKEPGYRFVLNQTAEDIRIKRQYAAKDSMPLCRRYQIISGQWLSVQYEKPPYVTTVKHLRCYPSEYYRQSPWPTYTWMPDLAAIGACAFDEYNTNDFCDLLPRATISIIGDSLSWEQYRSLIQLHNVPTRQGYQHQSYELNTNIQQPICEGGTTAVVYRRDDTLQYVKESIEQNFPTVLVLNRGAHYVPDDQLKLEMKSLIKVVQTWLKKCEKDYKIECHFFWRTSVPGHIGCNTTERAMTTPVYDLHDIEKTWIKNKSLYNDISREYHWHDFQHQNEIVLDLLKESGLLEKLNVQVIDAYHINTLRPDEHRANAGDCLHNCFPGKMDVYNRLLLHYLKMQRSQNDIQRLQKVATEKNWPMNILTEYDEVATQQARNIRLAKELAELERLNGKEKTDTKGKGNEQEDAEESQDAESGGDSNSNSDSSSGSTSKKSQTSKESNDSSDTKGADVDEKTDRSNGRNDGSIEHEDHSIENQDATDNKESDGSDNDDIDQSDDGDSENEDDDDEDEDDDDTDDDGEEEDGDSSDHDHKDSTEENQ